MVSSTEQPRSGGVRQVQWHAAARRRIRQRRCPGRTRIAVGIHDSMRPGRQHIHSEQRRLRKCRAKRARHRQRAAAHHQLLGGVLGIPHRAEGAVEALQAVTVYQGGHRQRVDMQIAAVQLLDDPQAVVLAGGEQSGAGVRRETHRTHHTRMGQL
eukprot:ctg_327.g162